MMAVESLEGLVHDGSGEPGRFGPRWQWRAWKVWSMMAVESLEGLVHDGSGEPGRFGP